MLVQPTVPRIRQLSIVGTVDLRSSHGSLPDASDASWRPLRSSRLQRPDGQRSLCRNVPTPYACRTTLRWNRIRQLSGKPKSRCSGGLPQELEAIQLWSDSGLLPTNWATRIPILSSRVHGAPNVLPRPLRQPNALPRLSAASIWSPGICGAIWTRQWSPS